MFRRPAARKRHREDRHDGDAEESVRAITSYELLVTNSSRTRLYVYYLSLDSPPR